MARVSIEDCLNVLENRFALVTVAAARTRQLMNGEEAMVKSKNKMAVTALREIAEGFVTSRVPEVVGDVTPIKSAPAAATEPAPPATGL
jgi:DNA-directed RNA polymerase subunit omega